MQAYLIGEIGQNHNGSIDIAKLIIDVACREIEESEFGIKIRGWDAVKLHKRDLENELANSALKEPYDSPNSFGKTYGEHRRHLELSEEQHFELYKYAKSRGLDFVDTLSGINCIEPILKLFTPDYLKVASFHLDNIPLVRALAETRIPLIISTGTAGKAELDEALNVITRFHSDLTILHCVSQYPTHPENANLNTIPYLKREYSDYRIGYSDHTIGISAAIAAIGMGAEVIEKHITLDRKMKGSDHIASLGPDGMRRLCRDARLLEMMAGEVDLKVSPGEEASIRKMGRSLAARRRIDPGEVIQRKDIHLLAPGDGYHWKDSHKVIGKKACQAIERNEIIYPSFLG